MVIYNTTYNVDEAVAEDWKDWLNAEFIPMVYDTGLFVKHIFSKVLVEEEMGGVTYSLQLFSPSMVMIRTYQDNQRGKIESKMMQKFNNKFVMFNTLLEVQDD